MPLESKNPTVFDCMHTLKLNTQELWWIRSRNTKNKEILIVVSLNILSIFQCTTSIPLKAKTNFVVHNNNNNKTVAWVYHMHATRGCMEMLWEWFSYSLFYKTNIQVCLPHDVLIILKFLLFPFSFTNFLFHNTVFFFFNLL
jgi:hypothetical protein